MKKILFLIHDLGQGGAEKVLVNLVNNMDSSKFDITVISLFGGGVNEQFLKPHIKYHAVFPKTIPGNSHLMKLLTPEQLHRICVKGHYDIEVSYLEGPSARVISGCIDSDTRLVSWIHVEQHTLKALARAFRSEQEAIKCYRRFDKTVCVSQFVQDDFCSIVKDVENTTVLYNTVESSVIRTDGEKPVPEFGDNGKIRLIAVGTLKASKGYTRLLSIMHKLVSEGYPVHLYILGKGPQQSEIEGLIQEKGLMGYVTLFGYQTNPYKYVSKCDMLVCSSFREGFSTAVTESLIIGTPVCTVDVSGMKELLGENNEYGVVTENSEEALYNGIKSLLDNPDKLKYYRKQAKTRGDSFNTENTVKAVENMLLELE